MNRKSLVASFGIVACLAAALSAQAPSSNGKVDQKAVQSTRVKVIGCVAGGAKAGRHILTGAFLSGDDTPSTVGTAGKIGSGTDLSFENSLSYDLMGAGLKAHVGHEVEIIGITSDARLNNSDALKGNPCELEHALVGHPQLVEHVATNLRGQVNRKGFIRRLESSAIC